MPPAKAPTQQDLQQAYQRLTDAQKAVVQLFALLYRPTTREQAHSCWSQSSISYLAEQPAGALTEQAIQDRLKLLDPKLFSQIVTRLIKQGVLTQERNQGPCCHDQLLEIATRDAVLTGTFEPMAAAVEKALPIPKYYQSSHYKFRNPAEFMRSLRIAIYREDSITIDNIYEDASQTYWLSDLPFFDVLQGILTDPFDSDWMDTLSDPFFEMGLTAI